MKKFILIIIGLFLFSNALFAIQPVKGDTVSMDGYKIIRVYGTHGERGYAYGFLLAKNIYEIYDNYFIQDLFGNDLNNYNLMYSMIQSLAVVDDEIVEECKGIVEGINDAGYADYFNSLVGREFTYNDIILANSVVELSSSFGCSSLMSWGDATAADPELNGDLIITRHLDWNVNKWLVNNNLITVNNPSEYDEQKWVSVGFCGLIGALSAVNESGVGVFQHQSNINRWDKATPFEPIHFSLRKAVEKRDCNGDYLSNIDDVIFCINKETQAGAFIVDAVNAISNGDSAIVFECTGNEKTTRSIGEYSNIAGTNLVATNHFRKLYPAIADPRYSGVQALIKDTTQINSETSWDILKNGAGQTSNLQCIQFIPKLLKLIVSFSKLSNDNIPTPAYDTEKHTFNFYDLYLSIPEEQTVTESNEITIYPNPVQNSIYIKSIKDISLIQIYNPVGMKVAQAENTKTMDINSLPVGFYFCIIKAGSSIEMKKIVVIK